MLLGNIIIYNNPLALVFKSYSLRDSEDQFPGWCPANYSALDELKPYDDDWNWIGMKISHRHPWWPSWRSCRWHLATRRLPRSNLSAVCRHFVPCFSERKQHLIIDRMHVNGTDIDRSLGYTAKPKQKKKNKEKITTKKVVVGRGDQRRSVQSWSQWTW